MAKLPSDGTFFPKEMQMQSTWNKGSWHVVDFIMKSQKFNVTSFILTEIDQARKKKKGFPQESSLCTTIMRMILNKSQLSLPLPLLPIFRLLQVDLLTMEITKKIIRSYLVWSRRNVFCLAFGLFISVPKPSRSIR